MDQPAPRQGYTGLDWIQSLVPNDAHSHSGNPLDPARPSKLLLLAVVNTLDPDAPAEQNAVACREKARSTRQSRLRDPYTFCAWLVDNLCNVKSTIWVNQSKLTLSSLPLLF
jgi:hypothetical protein